MAGERKTVHDRVLETYDVLYGSRPEKPSEIPLAGDGGPDAAELVARLRTELGISDEDPVPEGTLDDLIDYLHERWDGTTVDDDVEG